MFFFFSGAWDWDWEYADRVGKCESNWPYDANLAAVSLRKAEEELMGKQEIRDLTPRGVQLIVEAFKWGGASFHGTGWCPRHIEGVEHFFFYALEAQTGKKFLHGQAVCLAILVGAMMHGRRVEELRDGIKFIGVDMRPEAMGITWKDIDAIIMGLSKFVRAQSLPYGIAHDFKPDNDFCANLKKHVVG